MSWANDYVGLPYKPLGRNRDGIDCYGLVRLVLKEQCGIDLPSYSSEADRSGFRDDDPTHPEGREVRAQVIADQITMNGFYSVERDTLRPFDLLITRTYGDPIHIGLVVRPTLMLHTYGGSSATTSVIVDYSSPDWASRIIRCVRHHSN